MTWQSVSRMRFKEIGTYPSCRARRPGDGHAHPLPPMTVQEYLTYEELAPGTYPKLNISNVQLLADIRTYISINRVGAVVVDLTDLNSGAYGPVRNVPAVLSVFTQALGQPRYIGGVAIWSGLSR